MKKRIIISISFLVCSCILLAGCDPIYPLGKLKVEKNNNLKPGSTIEIEIIYPDLEGTFTSDWDNQRIEILSGKDVISVSGLRITGLKSGTARIKVSASAVYYAEENEEGREEKNYSTEVKIKIE